MNKIYALIIIVFLMILTKQFMIAQSTINPEISVIPRFRVESNDISQSSGKHEFSRPEFTLEEFELALQSYLNPYARADIFLTKAGLGREPIEIEEAYATFLRGLPLDMNLKIGKYHADFGRLNNSHPHAWSFITKPLNLERFLGSDGIGDLGMAVSFLIPTGDVVYTKLNFDIMKGSSIATVDPRTGLLSEGAGMIDTLNENIFYSNSARLTTFFPASENADLELGLSGLTGIHDPYRKYRFYYGIFDFKYKWKPDSYQSLTIQSELLMSHRKVFSSLSSDGLTQTRKINSSGVYLFADYQFWKIFTIGSRYDLSESPYSSENNAQAISFYLGYYPVEETTAFRLQFQHTITDIPGKNQIRDNMIALQFMMSMGPHKAHPF